MLDLAVVYLPTADVSSSTDEHDLNFEGSCENVEKGKRIRR